MPELVRKRRSAPYPGCGATVSVPAEIWDRTLRILGRYGELASEGLVYWGGVVSAGDLQVTGLYAPDHEPQGAAVRLTSQESRWLVRRLCARDEKLIAQVHSHPGEAFHSPGDDQHATSFHAGFYSIVVPQCARQVHKISSCAVFEFDGREFRALEPEDIGQRIKMLALVEERGNNASERSESTRPSWISTIASSLKRKLSGLRRR
jgi:proteasome lid subunit RPN8/RPN11